MTTTRANILYGQINFSMATTLMHDIRRHRAILIALFLMLNIAGAAQGLRISQSTVFISTGGSVVLNGDLVNNGSCINNNNTFVFNGGSQLLAGTTPVGFNDLIIDQASTTVMTTPGQSVGGILLCNGALNTNGYLTLLSTDIQTALIDGNGTGEVTGNVTMQRYLSSGFGYKYFSPPFQGSLVSEFSDNMKLDDPYPAFFRYDESRTTSGWVTYIDPAGILNPMEGYAVNFGSSSAPITFDVTGIVNNGTLSATLFNHDNLYTRGFSLVGNPYPSPIDWDSPSGWTRMNIDNALYYFEASTTDEFGGSYVTYLNGVSSNGMATNLIPSMQGFFIHVTDGSWPVTGSITITNETRVTDLTHPLIKSDADERSLIRLTAGYNNDVASFDPLVIYFEEKATENFDSQLDALKLMNTDYMVVNFYTVGSDDKKLSICALPFIADTLYTVPLGLSTNLDGNILFTVRTLEGDLNNMEIYLTDMVTGSMHDLKDGNNYEVSLPAGQYDNRFFLNFRSLETGFADNQAADDNLFSAYSSHGILRLNIKSIYGGEGRIMLQNLAGQVLLTEEYYTPGNYELNHSLKSGIYIVSFTSGLQKASKKIFVESR